MERRWPIKRLKSVDLPTFGRPTIAMSGAEDDMKSFSLSFRKITHPMFWDLNCLTLIYSSIDEDRKFENPAIGTNCRATRSASATTTRSLGDACGLKDKRALQSSDRFVFWPMKR